MTLDSKLALAGKVLEAVVVALLIYRRAWRNLPLFFAYSIWSLLSGCTNDLVMHYAPKAYFNTYFINNIIDSVLQFCVLVEVAWSVFRPFRASRRGDTGRLTIIETPRRPTKVPSLPLQAERGRFRDSTRLCSNPQVLP